MFNVEATNSATPSPYTLIGNLFKAVEAKELSFLESEAPSVLGGLSVQALEMKNAGSSECNQLEIPLGDVS